MFHPQPRHASIHAFFFFLRNEVDRRKKKKSSLTTSISYVTQTKKWIKKCIQYHSNCQSQLKMRSLKIPPVWMRRSATTTTISAPFDVTQGGGDRIPIGFLFHRDGNGTPECHLSRSSRRLWCGKKKLLKGNANMGHFLQLFGKKKKRKKQHGLLRDYRLASGRRLVCFFFVFTVEIRQVVYGNDVGNGWSQIPFSLAFGFDWRARKKHSNEDSASNW